MTMENIKSLAEVRSSLPSNPEIKHLTGQLSKYRSGMIVHVENFMFEGGLENPIESVLEVFGDYIHMCGHLESLAVEYEREGSEKSKESAGTIRTEYLPLFASLHEQFYRLKSLLSFVVKVGEARYEADHFERMLATRQPLAGQ